MPGEMSAKIEIKSDFMDESGEIDERVFADAVDEGVKAMAEECKKGILDEIDAQDVKWSGAFRDSIKIEKIDDAHYSISSDARSKIGDFPYPEVIESGFTEVDTSKMIYFKNAPDLRLYLLTKGWSFAKNTDYMIPPGKTEKDRIGGFPYNKIVKVGREPFAKGYFNTETEQAKALEKVMDEKLGG